LAALLTTLPRLLLLLTRLLLAATALLATLTALLTTLVLSALAALLATLAWILISHDLSFSCGKIPAEDNVHPTGKFLSLRKGRSLRRAAVALKSKSFPC
jgi:hypothetical protein